MFASISTTCTSKDKNVSQLDFNYVQYNYNNKLIIKEIPDNFWFKIYPQSKIYALPYKTPAYLIINFYQERSDETYDEDIETVKDTDTTTTITNKEVSYSATTVVVDKDSLHQFMFDEIPEYSEDDWRRNNMVKTNAINFTSPVILHNDSLKASLNYDPDKKELNYWYVKNPDYLKIILGKFVFDNKAFNLSEDTVLLYDKPSRLDTDTIMTKSFEVNKVPVKAYLIYRKQQLDEDGEGPNLVAYTDYFIKNTKIEASHVMIIDDDSLKDIDFDVHVMDNSTAIFLAHSFENPQRSGACGSCDYEITDFWIIDKDSVYPVFNIIENVGSMYVDYSSGNDSKRFYIQNDDSVYEGSEMAAGYWKNASTYALEISNDSLTRKVYIHFEKNPATQRYETKVQYGELIKETGATARSKFVLDKEARVLFSFTIQKNGKKLILYNKDNASLYYAFVDKNGYLELSYPSSFDDENGLRKGFTYKNDVLSFQNNDAAYKIWSQPNKLGIEISVKGKTFFIKGDARSTRGNLKQLSKLRLQNVVL